MEAYTEAGFFELHSWRRSFGINGKRIQVDCLLCSGYRSKNDVSPDLRKVRFTAEDVFDRR